MDDSSYIKAAEMRYFMIFITSAVIIFKHIISFYFPNYEETISHTKILKRLKKYFVLFLYFSYETQNEH